jgi:hypothetical protein
MNNVGLLMDKHGQWRTLLLDAAADNCDKGRTLPDVLADLVQLQILYEIERTILNKSGHFLTYLRTWYCMIAADSLRDSADGLEQ